MPTLRAIAAPPLAPDDIALLSRDEFLARRNKGGKSHPSDAYQTGVLDLNTDYSLTPKGTAKTRGGKQYTLQGNNNGFLVYDEDEQVKGVAHENTLYTDQAGVPLVYFTPYSNDPVDFSRYTKKTVKYPVEYTTLVSDTARLNKQKYPVLVQNLMVGEESLQLRAKGEPGPRVTLVITNSAFEVVAMASDEWGATLLRVADEYRGKGLGPILGKAWYNYNPTHESGGFTPSGERNAIAMWEARVREALAGGLYTDAVKRGLIDAPKVRAILKDVGPAKAAPEPKKKEPARLLFRILDDYGFILYDRAFLDEPNEKYIHAHGFFRRADPVGTFLFKLDYDRPYAKVATLTAFQMARDNGDPLYVGPGYGDTLELDDLSEFAVGGKPVIAVTGDYAQLTENVLNLKSLSATERAARKPMDPYGEVDNSLQEMADAKW